MRAFFFFRCSFAAFSPFLQNSPYIQAQGKNTRVPTLGYSGAVHNIYLPGGRRVRGFVGIEPLVHPCPKKCIFLRKKFVQPVRSVLVRTCTANRSKLKRGIVYISDFCTPYEPYGLFEVRTQFFQMRTEQSSSHCANLSGRGPSILLAQDRSVT